MRRWALDRINSEHINFQVMDEYIAKNIAYSSL